MFNVVRDIVASKGFDPCLNDELTLVIERDVNQLDLVDLPLLWVDDEGYYHRSKIVHCIVRGGCFVKVAIDPFDSLTEIEVARLTLMERGSFDPTPGGLYVASVDDEDRFYPLRWSRTRIEPKRFKRLKPRPHGF